MQEHSFTLLHKPLDPKQIPKKIWRRFAWMLPCLLFISAIVGYFLYQNYTHKLEVQILRGENNFITTTSQLLQKEIQQQMMILQMTSKSKALSRYFTATTDAEREAYRQQVEALFINLANTFQSHDQIRLISLNGQELAKTLYNSKFEQSIASNDLQDLSSSHYFKAAQTIQPNEAYVSKMELSLYKGKLEKPYKPILRFATPVLDDNGSKVGILMINYLAQDFLNSFSNKSKNDITSYAMLVDSQGFWLNHYNPQLEWGRDLNQLEKNIKIKHPQVWQQIQNKGSGSLHTDEGLFRFQSIEPFDFEDIHFFPAVKRLTVTPESINNTHWKLILFIPNKLIHKLSFFYQPLGVGLIFSGLTLIAFLLYLLINLYEQKRYQREYNKRANLELTDLYENAPCGYNTIDKQGYIKRVNNTLAQWLGYKKLELLNHHFSDFLTDNSKLLFNNLVEDLDTKEQVEGITLELISKDGRSFHVSLSASGIKDRDRLVVARTTVFNISDRVKLEKRLEKIANTDSLTGIHNRRYFFEQAEKFFPPHTPESHMLSALMFDVDYFKKINDTYGHKTGDLVLQSFTQAIQEHTEEGDIFARMGGEEFAILCHLDSPQATIDKAEKLRQVIEDLTIKINDKTSLSITVSIGCCHQRADISDIDQLMHQADTALYQAKIAGRNRVALH